MAYANTIGILIAAKDEASAVIAKTAAGTKAATGEVNSLGAASGATGSMLKTGLAVGLVAVVGESTNLAIKFQQHMEMLHTNSGVAQSAIAGLSNQILDMAASVGQGPDELAKAFYHIASAGTGIWDTAKQLDILKIAAEGAAIGQASLDDTTYALTSAMSSNIGGVKDAAGMMAVLNATVGAGDMKLQDLNGALSTGILSTAATFGISIQSVGTALATLTDNGEHADEAATRLRMTFALMGSPSGAATKQLEALGLTAEDAKKSTADMNAVFAKSGLSTTKLADDLRQPNGITAAMKDLKTHLENAGLSASESDAMLSKAFGGGRTDAALLTMLQNIDRMDEKYKVINENAGNFSKNFADQQQTDAQKIKNAWAGIQSDLTQLGAVTAPLVADGLQGLATGVKTVFDWYKSLNPTQKEFVDGLGLAAAGIGGVVLAAKGIDLGISIWKDTTKTIGDVRDGIKTAIDKAGEFASAAGDVASSWSGKLKDVLGSATETSKGMATKASEIASSWASAAADGVKSFGKMAAAGVKSATIATGAWLKELPTMLGQMSITALKATLHAIDISLAWTLTAVRVSFVWVTQELPKIVVGFITTSRSAVKEAATTAAAWTINAARVSFVWVTQELPKLVVGFVTTKIAALKEAAETSAAWVAQAARTSFAWVTTELPKIIIGFVTTKAAALRESAETAAAWVAQAAKTSFVWVVEELPKIVTSFIAVKGAAIAQAAETAATWVTAAVTSSASYEAFAALIATPLVMPAIAVGAALAAIALVYNAAMQARDAVNAASDAKSRLESEDSSLVNHFVAVYKDPNSDANAKALAKKFLHNDGVGGYALGTNFAPGGLTMVGENGPELVNLPTGSKVHTAKETQQAMGGGGTNLTITGGMHIHNNMDEQKFLANLGWRLSLR
ncbi:phage tail tape measure protein [Arthrobacter sp. M-10]|uniref:phage tail tape measure protein n=1 Tax=Arthrobacter sp. M-10 TaxID=3233037 RepID=UPI003F908E08